MKISAADVAARLVDAGHEVTKRTVERDLQSLSAVFPLLADTRSTPYGWSWQPHAAPFDVPQLTATQALAFTLLQQHAGALLPGAVAVELDPHFRMARLRLSDAARGGAGRRWLERIRVIPSTQPLIPPRVESAVHAAATDALLRECKLAIRYSSRGAAESLPAVVSPLGLVQRGVTLYLVVIFDGHEDCRTLALHRISTAEVLADRARVPQGFDLGQHVASGFMDFGDGRKIRLVARFEEEATIHLAESPLSNDQTLGSPRDGMVTVSATVADTPQLYWWLLGFAGRIEIQKPAQLRARMVAAVVTMAKQYGFSVIDGNVCPARQPSAQRIIR